MTYRFLISVLIVSFLLTSCNGNKTNQPTIGTDELQKNSIFSNDTLKEFSLKDFYTYDSRLAYKTDSIFNTMTDSERVAQMIIASIAEVDSVAKTISNELRHLGVYQNYAPVLDVSENNSAITNRSFGVNPKDVIKKSRGKRC